MKITSITIPIILFCLTGLSPLAGQEGAVVGFQDNDHDGVNDLFRDANGDGINDVTGLAYRHHFRFRDENRDGMNDLWRDADGDGVNDLLGSIERKQAGWVDLDGDGIRDSGFSGLRGKALEANVLDMDGDKRNDITGMKFNGRDLGGYRFGSVNEETGITSSEFKDADGDGMNDQFQAFARTRGQSGKDFFIDTDGDGIADDRGLGSLHGKGKKLGQEKKK